MQPIILYYNKKVLDKVGVQPPQSWGDIMDMVPKINAKGIAPFSLGGQSRWTNMMWLEFLFDRIGGSGGIPGGVQRRAERLVEPGSHSRR